MPGAGRPRRPEHVGRDDSADRWVGEVDPRASTGRKPGLSGLCGSAVSSRAQWPSATAAIERSLGGGRLGGGDSEAGAGPRAAGPEQSEAVGGVGGAGTISLRRMVCRLSRFGGSDGSRDQNVWRPEAWADDEISFGCKQPSNRIRINKTDLNYTATHRIQQHRRLIPEAGRGSC